MGRRWILMPISVALVIGFVFTLTMMVALAADSDVVISEVMYEAKIETGSPANRGEWIEVFNKGTTAVDLDGWKIQDNSSTINTIQATMCPGNSCEIPPGGCWLIARTEGDLQDEFNQYTNPLGQTVDASRTVFLNDRLGNGLANGSDNVILKNSSDGNVDCVSWASSSGTVCSSLSYVDGGNGADTNLNNAADGQSITNIQDTWYRHQTNGSPYDCTNTASGGSPTTITLRALTATAAPLSPLAVALPALGLVAAGSVAAYRRRKA